ncbi:MAG TPA: hypothetical protein VMF69_15750, partial [Gemmataceae bacterium]|nr:hypothetical protein [Gemmataceae bacterium]
NGTGANDSIFVLHTKKAIDAAQLRSQNPNVTYSERKVGKYLLQEPQNASTEAFCVLDKKRLVIGEKKALEAVLMRDKNPEFTNNLQEAIKQLDFSKTIAFAADAQSGRSAIGGGLGRFGPQNNIFGTLGKTRAIVAQAKIDADVRVTITLICEDAASANDVKKMIDGFAVMVRNSKSSPKEINDLLEWNLKVDDNKVTGSNTFKVGPLIKAFKQQQNFALPPGAFQREAGKPGFPNQQPKNPGLPPGARPGKRRPR